MQETSGLPIKVNVDVKADVTKPIEETASAIVRASEFLGRLFGPALETGSAIINDQFKHWRAANIERLRRKWLDRRMSRGLSEDAIKLLPFNLGLRLIEGAASEDDEEVQNLWAGLLDAATDPNSRKHVKRIHIDILRSISGIDARILKFLFVRAELGDLERVGLNKPESKKFWEEQLECFPVADRAIAIQNLKRQECVRLIPDEDVLERIDQIHNVLAPRKDVSKDGFIDIITAIKSLIADASGARDTHYFSGGVPEIVFELTDLGLDLMETCNYDKQEFPGVL
jgi:hypothetical protein